MRRPSRPSPGFSLIEAAVAIGIIAILAAAAVPLVMKALNQQREQKTRENLKVAFESLFGGKGVSLPSMMSDYGYQPPAANGQYTLQSMTTPQPVTIKLWGPDPGSPTFYWGWNPSYWSGSIRAQAGSNGVPVDAWGRPILMELQGVGANRTARLKSLGANGRDDGGGGDDLVYPPAPAPLSSLYSNISVKIVINKVVGNSVIATELSNAIQWQYSYARPRPAATAYSYTSPQGVGDSISLPSVTEPQIPGGPIRLSVTVSNSKLTPNPTTVTQILNLAPGKTENVNIVLNY